MENLKKGVDFSKSHDLEIYTSTPPVVESKGISLLNSEPNNNTTNNNTNKIDSTTPPVECRYDYHFIEQKSTPTVESKPGPFWILHLFSVEGNVEMTSTTIRKLLRERYGINASASSITVWLQRLYERGVLKRRKPWRINAGGRGGVRKAYYYSYTSLDAVCKAMAAYDEAEASFRGDATILHVIGLLERIAATLSRIEEKLR